MAEAVESVDRGVPYNRTKVELKHVLRAVGHAVVGAYNRTKVELKP